MNTSSTAAAPAGQRRLKRVSAAALTLAMAFGGAAVALAPSASAADSLLGTLSFTPASGADTTPFSVTSNSTGAQKGCPTGTTNIRGVVNGPGWSNVDIIGNTTNGFSTTDDFTTPTTDTMSGVAQSNGLTITPGDYVLTVICQNRLGTAVYGHFDGTLKFTSGTAYTSSAPVQSTATTLTATPASPQNAGTAVTFNASVSPAAAGAVQFKDGSTNLGSPVTVTGGNASLTTSALTSGSHSITAVFTPADNAAFTGSTSAPLAYTVSAAPATATTTTLSAPATVSQGVPAAFNVATGPAGTSGSVTLTENGTNIGSGTVTNGAGTVNATFSTTGPHTVVANFTPTGNYTPSSSQPVTVTVGAAPANTATETIETTISGGALTISVEDKSKVILPNPTLDTSAGLLVTSGKIHPVTVTDTRIGAPGFQVTGVVTDFTNAAGDKINAFDLGWAPNVIDKSTGMNVTPGPVVEPAPGLAPGVTPLSPNQGLGVARTLATNAPGGLGTTHLGADLTLKAPTSTKPGTYDATLTLTAI